MSSRIAVACSLVAALAAAPAPGAHAFERIEATFLSEYGAESYTIDQGEIVTFTNKDKFLAHGVVADAGSPFSAPVIGLGQVRLLRGAPFLTQAGSPYPFHCPIHPAMTSVLNVTAAGAPLPPDSIAPAAGVKIKAGKAARLVKKRKLRLVLSPSEPVDAVITAGAAGRTLGRAERTYVTVGARSVTLNLSGAAARAIAGEARGGPVKLRVKAALTDVAGNTAKVGAGRRLTGLPQPRPKPGD